MLEQSPLALFMSCSDWNVTWLLLFYVCTIWTIMCIGRHQAAGMDWKHSISEYPPALIKITLTHLGINSLNIIFVYRNMM